MKNLCVFLGAILLAGCASSEKKGVSRYDEFDAVKIDQMVGNSISKRVFEKTIICLNARREIRQVTALTNITVSPATNQIVNAVTSQTITVSTNFLVTTMTNLVPVVPSQPPTAPAPATAGGEGADPAPATPAALTDAATLPPLTNTPALISTNLTATIANNQSASTSPNQATANNQIVRTLNNQISTTSNNLTVVMMTNLVVSADTNDVVNYVTNYVVSSMTNVTIIPTNTLAYDYYLYTEMTPPSDFTLQSGESLVLLVDGERYGLTQSPPTSGFVGRKGFTIGLYRVPPEILVAIANAQDVRLRFRGVNSAIERDMNQSSRDNFKKFLLRYFSNQPEMPGATAQNEASSGDHASAALPASSARRFHLPDSFLKHPSP